MRRRALLALALLAPIAAFAQDNAALNEAASDAALSFMKALRKNDVETAMQFAGAPFVAEDSELLATEADVKAYLTNMCGQLEAAEMPNAVLAILDYDQSRAATAEQTLKLATPCSTRATWRAGRRRRAASWCTAACATWRTTSSRWCARASSSGSCC